MNSNYITFADALAWNPMLKLLLRLNAFPSEAYYWTESNNYFGLELYL